VNDSEFSVVTERIEQKKNKKGVYESIGREA